MRRFLFLWLSLMVVACGIMAAEVTVEGQTITVSPDGGQAKIIKLQVVTDAIIRVQAGAESQLPQKPQSLMVVEQKSCPRFEMKQDEETVYVKAAKVQATVNKLTGQVCFFDSKGNKLLNEARDGKRFWPYRVPGREIGVDSSKVSDEQRRGWTWHLLFEQQNDALYGLGQHQSEELNMQGCNEELFQYNTKVSVPFVISNKNYGILWDNYSYCRFGQPEDYLQLNRAFRLYDKRGREGHLTGTYTDRNGRRLVRDEDSIYFEYDLPAKQLPADEGGIKNLPKGFNLNGATVVYEGYLEEKDKADNNSTRQFILYYAGYIKVYIGGELVVPERWRTAWNPNTYKFKARMPRGKRVQLRIEWKPDGDVSYCGLRVALQRGFKDNQLSIWSEMAQDMDYYFISGQSMDEVISGYRTLTGKAPVYPKWVLGYWQSRERYKTGNEVESTLREFRHRHIPIDNIVQDWNYWEEDQWGSHRFDAVRFPHPKAMVDSIHRLHGRFMISVWPKFYCSTDHYKELDARGWMYHQAVEDDIHDWVGPGYVGSFYDAYSEGARKMFWQQLNDQLYTKLGATTNSSSLTLQSIDAWWMDASEPNVRDCTPMWYRKALCGPTALGTSTEYFNAYALVNADAIYNGQRSVNPNQRVFILTRSGFAGLQRYSTATWSGDIGTRWEDMRAQMTAGMNYSLSGLPFWGMDQGGFCVENRYVRAQQLYDRNKTENEDLKEWRELQARWNQFGTFIPLFRAHGQWPLREPWNVAPDNHPAYQSFVYYDRLRYHLMPYLYSMTGWVHFNDYTMMRALVMDFNGDPNVYNLKDQWMFGPSLMACPVSEYKARNRTVYFPKQCGWYDLYTGEHIGGGQRLVVDAPYERMPVFVPEGSIIPFGPAMEWSDEKTAELIQLYVYAGHDARFRLYEDEGTNYNYEKGNYATIDIVYNDTKKTLTIGKRIGSFDGMLRKRRFNVVFVTSANARPLDLDSPEGVMVEYTGKAVTTPLAANP